MKKLLENESLNNQLNMRIKQLSYENRKLKIGLHSLGKL